MRDVDFTWLTDHSIEIFEKYAGKWIAVRDEQIVGVGETATEAARQADEKVPDGDYILEAIDAHTDVIYGTA